MSTPTTSPTYADFERAGSGFSFTGKLAELARNSDWVEGYEGLKDSRLGRNQYSFLWESLSAGVESTGNELYRSIRNYIDNIGNIDVCGIDGLKNYASMLGISDDTIDINFEFPKEIKELVEIFSVNRAYLYNKSTDGTSLLTLSNSILHETTVEKMLDSLKDETKYRSLVRESFYNTLSKFINLTVGEFSSNFSEINASDKIWRLNISRFTDNLWEDDISSETDIYKLKMQLGVEKSFTEKIFVDDIIAGRRTLEDFDENEKAVLKAEIESRQTRYSRDTSMKYYFMRLYKVLEYFRFTTIAFRNSYDLKDYDISASKYIISDKTTDSDSILKTVGGEYSIDNSILMRVSEWLSDYSFELCNIRNRMKMQCQKNMMNGTKKLIVDTIREYLLERIDSDTWKNFKDTTLFRAHLNKGFDVSLVEYLDPTEYFNIVNDIDTIDKNENGLNPQFWKYGYDDCGMFDSEDVRNFYNRLTDSRNTFIKNSQSESGSDEPNLYDFLRNLFEMGATENSVFDADSEMVSYIATEGTTVSEDGATRLDDNAVSALRKFSGDPSIGDVPYANVKNTYHPSYQIHPFLNAFEEYDYAYTGIMNLVNSFTTSTDESRRRLSERLDELGNTINFWLNWNEDLTGYSTNYEKGGNDNDNKFNQDSPFNFKALNEFLTTDGFIPSILEKTNRFYIDDSTGKFILNEYELDREVQRLKKFKAQISELSNKEIYRYGKDKFGNIYILYKDEGERKNRDALGTMWIRLKGHPIAFPLFDFDQTQMTFSKISCMSDTNNAKLQSVISNILVKFEQSYGSDRISFNDSGRVDVNNLSLSVRSNVLTGINSIVDGEVQQLVAPTSYSEYSERLSNLSFVKKLIDGDIELNRSYKYFIDSVTNEAVPDGTVVTATIYNGSGSPTTCSITAGTRPISSCASDCFAAYFSKDGNTCNFELKGGGNILFAEFEEGVDTDSKTMFTYEADIDGKTYTRSCSKHSLVIRNTYNIPGDSLNGTYDLDGHVTISGIGISTVSSESGYSSLSSMGIKQTVDGGLLYEDYSKYSFRFSDDDIQSASGWILTGYSESDGYIATVGGSNFVFVLPAFSESDSDGKTLSSLEIHSLVKTDDTLSIAFSSDTYVRDPSATELSSATVYYPLDEVVFTEASGGYYGDSIRQFSPRGMENFVFSPRTTITDVVTSREALDELCATEAFSGYTGDVQTVVFEGVTCYYRLSSNQVSGLLVDSSVMTSVLCSDIVKFHGGFVLYSSEFDDTPIMLSFNDTESTSNLMTYSASYASENQQKFFDFGFSYDQSELMLNFSDGHAKRFQDSGMVIGNVNNSSEYGESDKITLLRDSIKNLEYVDPSSCGKSVHLGDGGNRKATFSAFGSFDVDSDGQTQLGISLFVFQKNSVDSYNYKMGLKYSPYNFGTADNPYYSCKVVVTEDRLYIAITCNTPHDSDVLSNTVNGVTAGSVGSATFSNISKYCGDSVITILSFDITELDNIEISDGETRYIMQNGALGYFPQYSGIAGKNLMFTNPQLSADDRFPFYAQFKEIDTTKELFSPITEYTARQPDGYDYGEISVERFIDTYDKSDAIRGFIFDEFDKNRVFHVNMPYDDALSSSRTVSAIECRNAVYDISRYTGDSSDNIHVLAENIDYAACTEALSCNGDCTSMDGILVPIWSDLDGHVRTDFKELFDVGSKYFYAMHGDGRTVSKLVLENRDGNSVFVYGGVSMLDDGTRIVGEENSTIGKPSASYGDNYCSWTIMSDGGSSERFFAVDSLGGITDNDVGSHDGEVFTFVVKSRGVEYPCALMSLSTGTRDSDSQKKLILKRFNPSDRSISESGLYISDGEKVFEVELSKIGPEKRLSSDSLGFATSICGGTYIKNSAHFIFGVDSPEDTVDDTDEKDAETQELTHIATFEHTRSDIVNSLLKLTIDFGDSDSNWTVSLERMEHSLDGVVKYPESDTVSSMVCENESFVVVAVNANGYSQLGWIDRNIAYSGSVSEKSSIYDFDGETEYAPMSLGQPMSIGNTVICAADGGDSILVSTDGGKNFYRAIESRGSLKRLIGCGKDRFYAESIDGRYVMFSEDGKNWKKELRFGNCKWRVLTNGISDYAACDGFYDTEGEWPVDDSHYVNVVWQKEIFSENLYEEMFVDYSDETIVLVSGLDGQSPIEITVGKAEGDFETFTFDHNDGIEYTSSYLFDGDVFLSPRNSANVLRITNVLDTEKETRFEYVDVHEELGNEAVSYRGFEVVNKTLVMYPSNGQRVLAYNSAANRFVNYYTFKNPMDIADSDKVGNYPDNELLFTLRESSESGAVSFCKTNFTGRDDYGVVEIDNGFPILVTYEKVMTNIGTDQNPDYVSVYEFTFTLLNAIKDSSVTIITTPVGQVPEKFKDRYANMVLKSKSYNIGSDAIVYTFATVDDTPKYCIYKHYEPDEDVFADYLNISYGFNDERRELKHIGYSSASNITGFASVYQDFEDFSLPDYISDPDDYPEIVKLNPTDGTEKISSLDAFIKCGYSNTASFSGIYGHLSPSDGMRTFVKDSNLVFMSPNTTLSSYNEMFKDCINADFGSTLYIEKRIDNLHRKDVNRSVTSWPEGTKIDVKEARSMFENCYSASIPSANISASVLTSMKSMFFNCKNAILDGITIPSGTVDMSDAFHNCQKCRFESISSIPTDMESMSGAFYGCTNGLFTDFTFN